jgi:hypothetical protein
VIEVGIGIRFAVGLDSIASNYSSIALNLLIWGSKILLIRAILKQYMDYKRIYESIMKTDPKIRLVTICDLNGKIMHSEHRQGVKNLLTPEESKKSLELAVKAWKTRSELTSKIGKGKYVLAEYERIKRITMPLGENHLLYVTTEIDADHSVITNAVSKLNLR